VVLGAFISGVFLALGAGAAAFAFIQPPDPLAEVEYQTTTVYYAGAEPGTPGEVMGRFADQRRDLVDYESLPPHIGHAVAAGEDKTFFTNRGVSLRAIGRAFLNNVQGKPTQGASTLTQQYVERYYQDTTTDYWGKAKEAILAIKISQNESKEMIMGRYLNTIYFGRDSYGIQAAAQSYFGVDAADLTVAQSAVLAAVIPSPNNWDPANNRAKAEQRWGIILDNMVEMGWLTSEERAAQVFPDPVVYQESETYRGPNGHLLKMVEKEMLATKLWTEGELRTKGLTIVTTIDKAVQDLAVQSADALRAGELTDGATPAPLLRMSIVTIDPATGGIVALYGGPDYLADTRNNATFEEIQAGSTYKPFTLVAALEQGIGLGTTYDAASPQEFDIGEAKPWRVQNFANSSRYGTIDLAAATADSVNTVYAQLNLEVGPEETARVASAAGATTEPTVVPSNVLGSDMVHPADMASAYATFAAQGVHRDRHIVQSVLDADGAAIWSPDTSGEQVFAPDVMADTTYALTQVVERGSARANVKPVGRPLAGKTGTSQENKSAWFIGYAPQLATAVALFENGENGKDLNSITAWGGLKQVTGGSHPAALWAHYMKQVFEQPKYAPVVDFPPRANVGRTAPPTPTELPSEEPTPEETQAPAEVQVPDGLVERTEADAVGALQAAGLTPRVVTERSATVPAGRVIRVEPGQGSTVATGATVTIVVSSGAPQPSPTPPPPPPTVEPTPAPTPAPTAPGGGDAAPPPGQGQGQGQGG